MFGGFHHYRAACGQGRSDLPGQKQQRRIPRGDCRYHAHRLAPGVDQVVRVRGGDLPALKLVGQPGVIVVPGSQAVHLADHLAVELARVVHFQLGKLLRVIGDQITQAAQQRRPGEPGELSPVAVQRGPRRRHRRVNVFPAAVGHHRPGLAGIRILRLECPPGDGIDRPAANHHAHPRQTCRHPARPLRARHTVAGIPPATMPWAAISPCHGHYEPREPKGCLTLIYRRRRPLQP